MQKLAFLVAACAAIVATAPSVALPPDVLPHGEGPFTLVDAQGIGPAMVNGAGEVVRSWAVGALGRGVSDKEVLPNGHLLMVGFGYAGILGEVGGASFEWPASDFVPDPLGSFLVEVDADGVPIWILSKAGGQPLTWTHDMDYLSATGTFLVADTMSTELYADRVIEIDRAGNVLWAYYPPEDAYPNDADLLPNGNVLVSLRNLDTVVEVNRAGAVVWSHGFPGGPISGQHNPDRLANGNTMIADSNHDRIVEVTPAGEIVWQYGDASLLSWPRDADLLPNGNVLITDSTNLRVTEIDRAGNVVWQFTNAGFAGNYDSDRLNDAPVIQVLSPEPNAVVGTHARFDILATDPSLDSATYRLFDRTTGAYVDPVALPVPQAPFSRVLTSAQPVPPRSGRRGRGRRGRRLPARRQHHPFRAPRGRVPDGGLIPERR